MKKKITLPSGAKCVMRPATGQDYYAAGADAFPDVFAPDSNKPEERAKSLNLEQRNELLSVTQRVLVACVSPLTMPDGRRLRLVCKDLDLVNESTEVHIAELGNEDFAAIQDAFTELSKEVADKARPFPEKPQIPPVAGHGGEPVRSDAELVTEPAG